MKPFFKRNLFGLICSVFVVCGCSDAVEKAGSEQNDSLRKVQLAYANSSASKKCCSPNEDSLLICDEFRSKFESKKYLCVISYSNECPIAKAYIKTIQNLVKLSRFLRAIS